MLNLLVYLTLTLLTSGLQAATHYVAPPPSSIQVIIDAASEGDTIQLSTGTYIEELLIPQNLTLKGNGIGVTFIQCPSSELSNSFTFTPSGLVYHPFIQIENASNVVIESLTVNGGSQESNFLKYRFIGIGFHNAGGVLRDLYVTNVQDSSPGGEAQHGMAIFGSVDNGNSYQLTVEDCIVDHFQKVGIDLRGNTLSATLKNNTICGSNPASQANVNGITIQKGTHAIITNNTINHLKSTVEGHESVGILLIDAAPETLIMDNNILDNNVGIYAISSGANLEVSGNKVSNSDDLGVYIQDTDGLTKIHNNQLIDNVEGNLYLYNSSTNENYELSHNQFVGGNIGLVIQGNGTIGPIVRMDHDEFIQNTIYFVEEIASPNDIWPSTKKVLFDGYISENITENEFANILSKIVDYHTDSSLGKVIDYLAPSKAPSAPKKFIGIIKEENFFNQKHFILHASFAESESLDVVAYRIYKAGLLVEEIDASSPLVFISFLGLDKSDWEYEVKSVSVENLESLAIPLKFVN